MVEGKMVFWDIAAVSPKRTFVYINGELVEFDDTSSSYCNEPVDLDGPPMNREERRHGKDWQLPEMREEWKRRRG